MINFAVKPCGKTVAVNALFASTREFCRDYLTDGQPDFSVTVTPSDIILEREKAAREDALEGLPVRNLSDELLERTALQRKIVEHLFDYDVLLFHGSAVEVDGEAYLFTAKSGTGKSTHTKLWRQVLGDRARMINDDKPFLRFDTEGITVYGSPWMGKHNLGTNISAPLKAICILERGEENNIRPITPQEALPMLFQQSQRPANGKHLPKYMDLIDKLASQGKFYRMACNMDPKAACMAYEAMSSGRKE